MTLLLFLSLNLLVTVVRLPVAGSSSEPAFFLKGIDYYLLPMDLLSLAFLMIETLLKIVDSGKSLGVSISECDCF